jgi:hypothetical protein
MPKSQAYYISIVLKVCKMLIDKFAFTDLGVDHLIRAGHRIHTWNQHIPSVVLTAPILENTTNQLSSTNRSGPPTTRTQRTTTKPASGAVQPGPSTVLPQSNATNPTSGTDIPLTSQQKAAIRERGWIPIKKTTPKFRNETIKVKWRVIRKNHASMKMTYKSKMEKAIERGDRDEEVVNQKLFDLCDEWKVLCSSWALHNRMINAERAALDAGRSAAQAARVARRALFRALNRPYPDPDQDFGSDDEGDDTEAGVKKRGRKVYIGGKGKGKGIMIWKESDDDDEEMQDEEEVQDGEGEEEEEEEEEQQDGEVQDDDEMQQEEEADPGNISISSGDIPSSSSSEEI